MKRINQAKSGMNILQRNVYFLRLVRAGALGKMKEGWNTVIIFYFILHE